MKSEKIMVAAGCFWGVQYYLDQIPGVTKTIVGYSGGHADNPTYEAVCSHTTGHAEVVMVDYDPDVLSFETLIKHFFRLHDPTQLNRQGPDVGDDYRSAIFYYTDKQKFVIDKVKSEVQTSLDKPIVTQISSATAFYPAEDYHQKFAKKTGIGMCHIPYKSLN